jgi:hypothetical protein
MQLEKVMKIGDWTSTEVFLKFYHRSRIGGAANCLSLLAKEQAREGRPRERPLDCRFIKHFILFLLLPWSDPVWG